jgi:hypothetical protein
VAMNEYLTAEWSREISEEWIHAYTCEIC